ncbi:glutamate receptor ionotropic, delta-2-like [Palaemon carinicauda]|uniref:glutamate receptor ionotropic, delta-2-like n=1 Tax=Palaemon carinicauda TaxID=392227 RepID=UPI0035B60ACC
MPDAKIALFGRQRDVQSALWMPAFQNSIHILYLGLDDVTLKTSSPSGVVTMYSRRLFPDGESREVRVLSSWVLGCEEPKAFDPFPYNVRDLHGHLLRAVSLPFFPYVDYQMNLQDLSKPVALRNSLDKKLIETISSIMNFTYEVYTPADVRVGIPLPNGSWTGMIGTLQRGDVDISLMITINAARLAFMDLARVCESDPIIITSLTPQFIPKYLAIVSPFTANVWAYLVLSIVIWGVSFWLLGEVRSKFTGERSLTLNESLFYSWGIILEEPPPRPPRHSTGQVLLGWWLVAVLVISTGYRSSLVANLSVQSKMKPIDSYEDLLSQRNWHWGIQDTIISGQPNIRTNDQDPVLKKIYENSEPISVERGLEKIVQGGYSFLVTRTRVRTDIATKYTDEYGRTFIYTSKQSYKILSDFGWGFRKGSPYYNLFVGIFNRLIDAGIIDYWIAESIASRVRQIRKETQGADVSSSIDVDNLFESNEVVLKTRHFIGVFLVMLAGFSIALPTLLVENLIDNYHRSR